MPALRVVVDPNILGCFQELSPELHAAATSIEAVSRDAADDCLLSLCKQTKADVLLTGDDDLLVLEKHGKARIMNARMFAGEYLR